MDSTSTPCPTVEQHADDTLTLLADKLSAIESRLNSIEKAISAAQERDENLSKQQPSAIEILQDLKKDGEVGNRLGATSIFVTIAISLIILGITLIIGHLAPDLGRIYGVAYFLSGSILFLVYNHIIDWMFESEKKRERKRKKR